MVSFTTLVSMYFEYFFLSRNKDKKFLKLVFKREYLPSNGYRHARTLAAKKSYSIHFLSVSRKRLRIDYKWWLCNGLLCSNQHFLCCIKKVFEIKMEIKIYRMIKHQTNLERIFYLFFGADDVVFCRTTVFVILD
jgi:hypothetical protein